MRIIDTDNTNKKAHVHFNIGGFWTRWSERYGAGLVNNLVMNQVLMQAFKTTGGLKNGIGMSDYKE